MRIPRLDFNYTCSSLPQSISKSKAAASNFSKIMAELPQALTQYSLPGVLHFLQAEWRSFERQRNEWELERSDLKV